MFFRRANALTASRTLGFERKCVVVIEGQLTLELGNVVYTLEAADSVTFEVAGEYRFRNKSARLCRYYIFMSHSRLQSQ